MKIEQRTVYIAEDGREFDTEEYCRRHETICTLSSALSTMASVDEYYSLPISVVIVDYFDRIKEIVEGSYD